MNILAASIFDLGTQRPEVSEGIEFFRGWNTDSNPVWSRDSEVHLRIDAKRYPHPVNLTFKVRTFSPETMQDQPFFILSDGHEPMQVAVAESEEQFITFQSPVMRPDSPWGFVTLRTPATQSPAKLGMSADDRLLGIQIVSVHENLVVPTFPIDLREDGEIADTVLKSGWADVEVGTGVWSVQQQAEFVLPGYIDLCEAKALSFEINTLPRSEDRPPLEISLSHKGEWLTTWEFAQSSSGVFTCPLDMAQPGTDFGITFKMENLASPVMLGINADPRMLGVLLRSVDVIRWS